MFSYLLAKHVYSIYQVKFNLYINVKMMCTLWDHYAKQVYDHIMSYMSTIIICVTRFSSIVLLEWKCIYKT